MTNTEQSRLLSHTVSPNDLKQTLTSIRDHIKQNAANSQFSEEEQYRILEQLAQFDFGRYLLQNRGINGFWTHYMLTHPWYGRKTRKNNRGDAISELEAFILDRAPTMLATQQRFEIFLRENQQSVKNGAKLACIPCGMMGELLYLNYDKVEHIDLIGIDYDAEALKDAHLLADKMGLTKRIHCLQEDAWALKHMNEFDLISSNGLNIYEPDDEKVTKLYQQFFKALKTGGKLVTSFLTYPPMLTNQCEWDMSKINMKDLQKQRLIFADIIQAKWQCFRSSLQTKEQLESVGFTNVHFIYDEAKLFPTVVALKT